MTFFDASRTMQALLLLRHMSLISIAILLSKLFVINDIGEWENLQVLLTSLSVFWLNGILQWLLPTYERTETQEREALLQRVFYIFFSLSAIVIILMLSQKNLLAAFFFHSQPPAMTTLFCLCAGLFLPTYFLEFLLFSKKKFRKVLIISTFTFVYQNLSVIIAYVLGWGIEGILWLWLWLAIGRLVYLASLVTWRPIPYATRAILIGAAPLIGYSFMAQWATTFDAWLVNYTYAGDTSLFAIFRYGARELPIVLTLSSGLSNALSAQISEDYTSGIALLKQKSTRLMHFAFPFSILLIITAKFWFPLLFSSKMMESIPIFNLFLMLAMSRMLFSQTVAVAKGEHRALFYVSVTELCINIIFSTIFVQYFGLWGIALGTVIAFVSEKIILAIYLFIKHDISIHTYCDWRIYVGYCILMILGYFLSS